MRVLILLSGTGSNAAALLEQVRAGSLPLDVVAVGADRRCDGLIWAQQAGLETFLVDYRGFDARADWDAALLAEVNRYTPDYVLTLGFMRILGRPFVERYENRVINTHPSLLPAFPGANAVADALAHGVKVTGCTVMLTDTGVDTGPILAQAALEVRVDDDQHSLHERIKEQERRLLHHVLKELACGAAPSRAGNTLETGLERE